MSKISVECEVQTSTFCKKVYTVKEYYYNRRKKEGTYRCLYCAIDDTHKGEKSHFFKYEKNENFFEVIDTDLKAYLLGVIAGDGWISDKQISLVANLQDVETLNTFCEALFTGDRPEFYKSDNCYAVGATSAKLVQDVCKHLRVSPGKKSDKITLPNLSNNNLIWAFIRGLFDTDGHVSNIYKKQKSPQSYCSSTSKLILEQIKTFCVQFNIKSSITGVKLKFNGTETIKFLSILYENEFVALTRKKEMYKLWLSWKPRQGCIAWQRKPSNKKGKKIVVSEKHRAALVILVENNRKLQTGQILEIFKYAKSGMSRKSIAQIYSVSNSTISSILNRKSYQHIEVNYE